MENEFPYCGSAYACFFCPTAHNVSYLVGHKGFVQTRDKKLSSIRQFIVNNPGQHIFPGGSIKDPADESDRDFMTNDPSLAAETASQLFQDETGIVCSTDTVENEVTITFSGGASTHPYTILGFPAGFAVIFVNVVHPELLTSLHRVIHENIVNKTTASDELMGVEIQQLTVLPKMDENPSLSRGVTNNSLGIASASMMMSMTLATVKSKAMQYISTLRPTRVPHDGAGEFPVLVDLEVDSVFTAPSVVFCFANSVLGSCVPASYATTFDPTLCKEVLSSAAAIVEVLTAAIEAQKYYVGRILAAFVDRFEKQVMRGFCAAIVSAVQVAWFNRRWGAGGNDLNALEFAAGVLQVLTEAFTAKVNDITRASVGAALGGIKNDLKLIAPCDPTTASLAWAAPTVGTQFKVANFKTGWFMLIAKKALAMSSINWGNAEPGLIHV